MNGVAAESSTANSSGTHRKPGRQAARLRARAWWITAGYAGFAMLWIYYSDRALGRLIADPDLRLQISVFKGLAFVLVTAVLLLFVMRRAFGTIGDNYDALQAHEAEIQRLNRLYTALSQINQAIVRLPGREELLQRLCEVLVREGGFSLVWVGWYEPETRRLAPMGVAGEASEYIRDLRVYADDRPEGRGPVRRAFREGRPVVSNDFLNDPGTLPWREDAGQRGIRAGAAFPIRRLGQVVGTLNIYATEPGFFQDREIALLVEAASDVSFALDNLAREEERQRAEARALNEKLFSVTMIESMPGIVYFYDERGGFLRWNRNFEQVSGYSAAEIAQMHPLDFFAPADQPLVQARIGEVFTLGESSLEAPFRAKDGTTRMYFFTGRSVLFEGQPCLVGMGIDISERQRAEQALRDSEHRHRTTLDNILEGCQLIGFDGRYLYLNDATALHNRRPNAELLGRTVWEVWPGIKQTRVFAFIERCLQARVAVQAEVEFTFPDGSVGWFDLRVQPVDEGALVLSIDRTERKLAEETRDRLAAIVNFSNDAIISETLDAVITSWNQGAERMFGYSAEEIVGQPVSILFPPGEEHDERKILAQIRPGNSTQLETVRRRKDGSLLNVALTLSPILDHAGRVVGASKIARDISARKRAELALQTLNKTLELEVAARTADLSAALVRAEAADRLKSAFLATMSHELRTPLNSIIGFTGILLQGLPGPLNPEQTKQLGMVKGSARHLLELINDVLDISKIEAGQLEVRAEPFDPGESIARVTASVKSFAEKKGVALGVNLPATLPQMVSDRRRVEQILLNLLNNALKFTEEGEVTLTVETVAGFRFAPEAGPVPALRLRVADTGIGIKPEDLALLFQPFRQLDTGLTRQHEGTGLGLAICRRLAHLMGGEISADSEWLKGSVFTVVLPMCPPTAP
jgi:PAS domain S-box-containing protein